MDLLSDASIRKQYKIDQQKHTLNMGKLLSIWGIPATSIICLAEWLTYHNPGFVFCRLLFIVPMMFFLIFSYSLFRKNLNIVIPLHVITISGGLLMMTVHTIVKFKSDAFAPEIVFPTANWERTYDVTNGLPKN